MKKLFSFLFLFYGTFVYASEFSFEEDFSLPIVRLNLVLDAGSVQDPTEKSGIANLTAEMLLRGTQKLSKTAFQNTIDQIGSSVDISTTPEGILIHASCLAENLPQLLDLLTQSLLEPRFLENEFVLLKKEEESKILEQRGDDKALLIKHFQSFYYQGHPYQNLISGTLSSLKKIHIQDIKDFYKSYFTGTNISLLGTGAAKQTDLLTWYQQTSEKLSALNPQAKAAKGVALPVLSESKALLVDKPKATQSQFFLGTSGIRPEHPAFYVVQLANYAFGGATFQARLMQEHRVKRGWTYGASSRFSFGKQPKHYLMYSFPKTDDTIPSIELMLKMFNDFVRFGLTKEEFEFAKTSTIQSAPFNYDTPEKRLENAVNEHLFSFPKKYFQNFASEIEKVQFEEILPGLQKVFDPQHIVLVVVGDATKLKKPLQSQLSIFSSLKTKSYLED